MLLAKKLKNLVVLGEAPDLVLRKDELSIYDDIKDAIGALDQLRLDAELIGDFGRQTGSLWKIVSGYAIGNRDSHAFDSSFRSALSPDCG